MANPSKVIVLLAASLVAGCAQLPIGGPAQRDISKGALVQLSVDKSAIAYDYALIDVTADVLDSLAQTAGTSFQSLVSSIEEGPPRAEVGVGDVLQVTVFESSAGGLFLPAESGPRPANSITVPIQAVARSGDISFPYAGKIQAAGRSVSEIEQDIQAKISSRAIEPQVVVTMVEQNSATVSVIGDTLNGANKFKLTGSGERVLDMIARAGGTRYPGHELFVTLMRDQRHATIGFPKLVNNSDENIFVRPGDTIYVHRQLQKYIAIGALGSSTQSSGLTGQYPFEQERLSLNEAIAKAGGLLDTRADASMVFLYRIEQRNVLERAGIDLVGFPPEQSSIPAIYRLNFRDPSGFFAAQRLMMRDRDVIYVANSDSTELRKLFDHARAITSTLSGIASDISVVGNIITGGSASSP